MWCKSQSRVEGGTKEKTKSALMQFTVVLAFIFKQDSREAKEKEKKRLDDEEVCCGND